MPTTSFQISKDLHLVQQATDAAAAPTPAKVVEPPRKHLVVIDCSGSMYGDLPKVREQIKRKVPKLLREEDTLSIIWFSGRGQFGTLLEDEPIATLKDLKAVEQTIDRWLRPQGLTGFKEPIEEVGKLVDRLAKKTPGALFSLFFMSDGCDNQWPRADILKAIEKAAGGIASTTIVEYGYYADRPLLSAMAEKSGGAHIFAETFDRYEPVFEAALQKKASGAPRVEVAIEGDPVGGFVFALADGDLITYAVEGGKATMPKDLKRFYYLSPTELGSHGGSVQEYAKNLANKLTLDSSGSVALSATYAAVSLFAVRMKPNVVYPLLKALGDVDLIERFASCFGKQKYSEFQERAQRATFGTDRFTKGFDPNKVPRDDAFTVLDVLNLLASDDQNRVLLDNPHFKYSKIGRGRVDASDQLTADEQAEIQRLTSKLATEKKASEVKKIQEEISAITDKKGPALKFEADPAPDGYPISSLTFNEERPNVSFLVRKSGVVDISARVTDEFKTVLPAQIKTNIFRNYAVIKDGLVNIDTLPIRVNKATKDKLVAELGEFHPAIETGGNLPNDMSEILLDLRSLPVINRKMVKDVSAKAFFETQYALAVSRAAQKVYNAYSKELLPSKRSEGIATLYGEAAAAWLKEQGITDGGFSPKSVTAEPSGDFYMSKELTIALKGLSKLPSLKEVKEQISKNKINAGGALMVPTVKLVESFLESDIYKKAAQKEKVLEVWLEGQTKAAKAETRDLIFKIAQTTFTLIVGQVWFSEFASLDENSMTLALADGGKLECKAEMREVEIKL